jgi:hypothetical protein
MKVGVYEKSDRKIERINDCLRVELQIIINVTGNDRVCG